MNEFYDYESQIKQLIKDNCPFELSDFGKMYRSKVGLLLIKSLGYGLNGQLIQLLACIELVHTASLLHDDVIDGDTFRRNKDLNNKTSVLYGDIVLTNIVNILLTMNNHKLLKLFNSTINSMCKGEVFQIEMLNKIPSLNDYIYKSEQKTGILFETLVYGIFYILNIEPKPELIEFAKSIGIAFQINNDLADLKDDISTGIYTAPVVFSGSINITASSIEKTKSLIDNYISKALKCLNILEESFYKKTLIEVIKCLEV